MANITTGHWMWKGFDPPVTPNNDPNGYLSSSVDSGSLLAEAVGVCAPGHRSCGLRTSITPSTMRTKSRYTLFSYYLGPEILRANKAQKYSFYNPCRHSLRTIYSIVAASMTSSGRREKVYCEKWIHEGVCAFTQVGCKYLHTMPMNVETQVKLGLYHGLPRWYCVRTENWRQIGEPANNSGNNNAGTIA
ncbi:hypothetical protein BKA64DRAFT_641020 [Cadophora sp. MPI-SDFR-AT-0126]|nr:hypothetical protein BKA64DRAFT_641020 [Leotiomycetes sp. MPI-SDFR-AT-0126]